MDYDYFVSGTPRAYPGYELFGPMNRHAVFNTPSGSAWIDSTDPQFAGVQLTAGGSGSTLRFPDGGLWNFNTTGALISTLRPTQPAGRRWPPWQSRYARRRRGSAPAD